MQNNNSFKTFVKSMIGTPRRSSYLPGLNFTKPTDDCLYVKILKVLNAASSKLTKNQIYSSISGTEKRDYKRDDGTIERKWLNHSILTWLVIPGLVTRIGKFYEISDIGRKYLAASNL